jgi:hypothetical protein
MSILVHDGKQKICISTLLTIDLQISLQFSWFFLTSKKLFSMKSGQWSGQLFQCGNTIQNGDLRIQPWVDYINTMLWRMLDLCYSTI